MRRYPIGWRWSPVLSAFLLAAIVASVSSSVATARSGSGPVVSEFVISDVPRDGVECTRLMNLSLPNTVISSATVVPAKGEMPEYCKVIGGVEQVILFEIDLPTTNWNGKFFYAGGGGYNGTIPTLAHAVVRGYAAAGSDTGHRGEHWDASALYNNPPAQINYAHRGAHLVTATGKEVVRAFYGRPERHAYFMGCSNGGKMGLMAVQRYPDDYEDVRKANGPAADEFVRLFMPPGMYHCGRGPGPNAFGARGQEIVKMGDPDYDIMAALDRWVEQGVAPAKIIATKFNGDDPKQGIARTRPICQYPQVAKYKGSGSIDDAANFVCGTAE